MLCEIEGTEHSLIMEPTLKLYLLHIEIVVILIVMNQLYIDLRLTMSKRAEIPILTILYIVRVVRTKLDLILVYPIQLLKIT